MYSLPASHVSFFLQLWALLSFLLNIAQTIDWQMFQSLLCNLQADFRFSNSVFQVPDI